MIRPTVKLITMQDHQPFNDTSEASTSTNFANIINLPEFPNPNGPKKVTAAELRFMRDIKELNLPRNCTAEFPDSNNLLNFRLVICPEEGYYKSGRFVFSIEVGQNYPHEAPKVKCETPVFHPNIDLKGNICLNILREDWRPVLTITSIVYGLQYLFMEPNYEDPLNREAAQLLARNTDQFAQNVQKAIEGGYVGRNYFQGCLREPKQ